MSAAGSRVLITGATGHLGHHLLPRLLSDGWQIVAASRTRPKREGNGLTWKEADLLQGEGLRGLATGCDSLVHMAMISKSELAQEVKVAEGLAQEAIASGVRHFFYTSSIRVYGSAVGIADEKTLPRPCDPYGEIKLQIEELLREMLSPAGVSLRILRLAHVVSEASRPTLAPQLSLRYLLCWGRTFPHYIDATDAAAAITYLMNARERLRHGIYNINRELDSPHTYGGLYGPILSPWKRGACRAFAAPKLLAHWLSRGRPEAREGRAARIVERNLRDEGWMFEGNGMRGYFQRTAPAGQGSSEGSVHVESTR